VGLGSCGFGGFVGGLIELIVGVGMGLGCLKEFRRVFGKGDKVEMYYLGGTFPRQHILTSEMARAGRDFAC